MENRKQQIESFLKHHQYELTHERKIMISILYEMDEFDMKDFRVKCLDKKVTNQTIYSFRNILIDANIIIPEVKIPARFNIDFSVDKNVKPRKKIKNEIVHKRVMKSFES